MSNVAVNSYPSVQTGRKLDLRVKGKSLDANVRIIFFVEFVLSKRKEKKGREERSRINVPRLVTKKVATCIAKVKR